MNAQVVSIASQRPVSANACGPDILLIEDSPTNAELFAMALKINKSKATARIAHDGTEALDLLLGAAPCGGTCALPRLVILDIHLPRLDGFQVLDRLRADERTRLLPVIVYSSSDMDLDRREAFRRGANGYVRKPMGFKDACEAIARIEHLWLGADAALPDPMP